MYAQTNKQTSTHTTGGIHYYILIANVSAVYLLVPSACLTVDLCLHSERKSALMLDLAMEMFAPGPAQSEWLHFSS